jgi:NAD(P)-dependent dehydrogenase (short-subunit alcohol dehydrogenase family)
VRPSPLMGLGQFDLTGKVAVVTGGGRGLGRAIAIGLAACGAKVVVGSRKIEDCQSTVGAIEAECGGEAIAQSIDVLDRKACDEFVAAAVRRFGRLDILMSNAGICIPKAALETDEQDWRQTMDVDLTGCFNMSVAAGRHMIERHRAGAIVITSSNASTVAFSRLAAYGAAKGGVDQLVRSLAFEWGSSGIRVNGIAPGWTEHNMRDNETLVDDPAVVDQINVRTPLGRVGRVEEIARPAIFLASPAASFVTGVILRVDGGYGLG